VTVHGTGVLIRLATADETAERGGAGWELMSAPRRIDLAPELKARLAPVKRG
jgi:hypothetical protein